MLKRARSLDQRLSEAYGTILSRKSNITVKPSHIRKSRAAPARSALNVHASTLVL